MNFVWGSGTSLSTLLDGESNCGFDVYGRLKPAPWTLPLEYLTIERTRKIEKCISVVKDDCIYCIYREWEACADVPQ